jgi:hypothetical protein
MRALLLTLALFSDLGATLKRNADRLLQTAIEDQQRGGYPSAIRDYRSVLQLRPCSLEPHAELASLYYRLHRRADGARERQIVDRITAEQQAQGPGKL